MTESKIELTERLRREGRWDEASLFKDATVKELRAGGMARADASEEAWRRMAARYPPLTNTREPGAGAPIATSGEPSPPPWPRDAEPDIDVDALLDRVRDDRQPADLVKDTLWVYGTLENRRAKPEDAPSLGAWSLLQWARQYRNRFFEQVLPRAMQNRVPEDEENIRQEKRSIAEIERILGQFQEDEDETEELPATTPATIQAGVRSRLTDWAGRFGLSLPDGAQASLEAHIAEFVHDCIKATGRTPGGVK